MVSFVFGCGAFQTVPYFELFTFSRLYPDVGAYYRAFRFFVSSYGQDFERHFLNVSLSTSVTEDTIKVKVFDSVFVDLIQRYEFICEGKFCCAALVSTERLVGTVNDKVAKVCFDESIAICLRVAVAVFLLFDLPTILA